MTDDAADLTHVVLLAIKPEADAAEVADVLDAIRGFTRMEGVISVTASGDVAIGRATSRFTHGVVIEFADAAALDRYLPHPAHQAVVARLEPLIADKLIVDISTSIPAAYTSQNGGA